MEDTRLYTAANRVGWNKIAGDRHAKGSQFFRDGRITLAEVETQLVGDVTSKTLLHLGCANGNDTLSWAVRGARVTGVDISDVAVQIAQDTADQAQLAARFLAADVYDLPADLGQFDIVYMSWGAICWMPDLGRWAQIIRDHLRPGASLALFEHHPLWEILGVQDGELKLLGDYFGRQPRDLQHTDPAKQPTGATADAELTSFVWPIGDVLASLAGAGLKITHFSEGPGAFQGLGLRAAWLPGFTPSWPPSLANIKIVVQLACN